MFRITAARKMESDGEEKQPWVTVILYKTQKDHINMVFTAGTQNAHTSTSLHAFVLKTAPGGALLQNFK